MREEEEGQEEGEEGQEEAVPRPGPICCPGRRAGSRCSAQCTTIRGDQGHSHSVVVYNCCMDYRNGTLTHLEDQVADERADLQLADLIDRTGRGPALCQRGAGGWATGGGCRRGYSCTGV